MTGPLLIWPTHGCHSCPNWQRAGGNASAVGRCGLGDRANWLTSYAYICPLHPNYEEMV